MAYFSKEKFIDILEAKADMAVGTPKMVFLSVVKMLEKLPEVNVEIKECKNISDLHPVDEFHCSNCGLILEDYTRKVIDEDDGDVCHYEYEMKFCPECGLKVGADE